ncbi:MAG: hypothetical protein JW716_05170 [Candidatus Aenigmarchaeota archaeon]|nr:hypothetical protein [Candidatus Aenigmarchaeota archaeon]
MGMLNLFEPPEYLQKLRSIYDDMSNPEKMVAETLTKMGLWWNYEQPVFVVDDKERPRVWTPDFYIPRLGIYIEVCGAERDESYNFRREVYFANSIPVVFVQTYKKDKWLDYMIGEINKIHEMRWEIIKNMKI